MPALIAVVLVVGGYDRWGVPFLLVAGVLGWGALTAGRYWQGIVHARSVRRTHWALIRGGRR